MPSRLAYTPLERLAVSKPVDRIEYLKECCLSKAVIDLGALDETAFMAKRGNGTWVHEEIARVASRVIGLDSSNLVPADGLITGPRSLILRSTTEQLPELLHSHGYSPDVVVAGELIEHVANPLEFLSTLRHVPQLQGKSLLLTTPNATALHNVLIGMSSRESTHPDHLCILSFKTLNTLFIKAGFSGWTILPYYARFTEMHERSRGVIRGFVKTSEKLVNAGEWLFPMLSFGWIANVQI